MGKRRLSSIYIRPSHTVSTHIALPPCLQVLKAEGLEKYADVKSVTSELASAMDLTPEELEHVASELIEIASHRGTYFALGVFVENIKKYSETPLRRTR